MRHLRGRHSRACLYTKSNRDRSLGGGWLLLGGTEDNLLGATSPAFETRGYITVVRQELKLCQGCEVNDGVETTVLRAYSAYVIMTTSLPSPPPPPLLSSPSLLLQFWSETRRRQSRTGMLTTARRSRRKDRGIISSRKPSYCTLEA